MPRRCDSRPSTYIEGLWRRCKRWRRPGVARTWSRPALAWGRSRGRTEMAADVRLTNLLSQAVHDRLGFAETGSGCVTHRLSAGLTSAT